MTRYIYMYFILFLVIAYTSCNQEHNEGKTTCDEQLMPTIRKNFEKRFMGDTLTGELVSLDSFISIIDDAMKRCGPSFEFELINYKLSALEWADRPQQTFNFALSIDSSFFSYPYLKDIIVFKNMAKYYDEQNDVHRRDSCYKLLASSLEEHLDVNGPDDNIFLMLYSVKSNYIDTNSLIQELDSIDADMGYNEHLIVRVKYYVTDDPAYDLNPDELPEMTEMINHE